MSLADPRRASFIFDYKNCAGAGVAISLPSKECDCRPTPDDLLEVLVVVFFLGHSSLSKDEDSTLEGMCVPKQGYITACFTKSLIFPFIFHETRRTAGFTDSTP
jgi:hypothetical protein